MNVNVRQRPVAEGVFTWPSEDPQLIGGRSTESGIIGFSAHDTCPACTGSRTETH